ncbi:unnamed protein product, partial [Iphiclides podalirius]
MTSQALASLTATYTDSEGEEDMEDGQQTPEKEEPKATQSAPNSPRHVEELVKPSSAPVSPKRRLVSYNDDTVVSDEEQSSPSAENQDDMRRLSMETDTDEAVQKSDPDDSEDGVVIPPEPTGKCPKELQETIAKFYSRMVNEGLDMNKIIQDKKNFRNPSIYEKLIQFCDINELDTNYPPEIYDPLKWGKESYYDELARIQKVEMDRREKEKKEKLAKIDFISGVVKKSESDEEKKRKSKWDQAAPNVAAKPAIKQPGLVQQPLTTNVTDVAQSEPVPSSSEKIESDIKDDAPLAKKRKILSEREQSDKLEHRLGGILCCAVCLDLPPGAVYQCSNGHLMCAPCFTHLLADARLRDEAATCPNCRIEISKTSASRNLAVEKTVSELPLECRFCTHVYPRHSLQHHEENICDERLMGCKYACIGCRWRGPAHEAAEHESRCPHPANSAADLLALLAEKERDARQATAVYEQILDLLSYEKITFNDLQLKPYRTEEFVHKLYYESSRFTAFGHQWVVKAFVNKNQRDPTQSAQREITYQLMLKSKTGSPLCVQWVVARGPWGEARLEAQVGAHAFRDEAPDAPPRALPLHDPSDANRLLATKPLHCRLIMFLSSK